ncbi:hypothetical protein KXW98_000156 [Aspergillus fumigatus]|nr:hypothetical protein CNMCM8714_001849 [Aspergillus fumigatus]KMK54414.1 YCII-like domain-containing protein [Aspergillus fumigatus Z5]KAF4274751.1 hypothetical protein CNMCM8812_004298 [Aspergillus fumigatus]KAF4278700.1 hypothetical protein CNMCM8057_008882 [Aspergillus fumigatus]KAF4286444.1 hypothetical protein CNMCM8689_002588 [Aspergillus fumigatus]
MASTKHEFLCILPDKPDALAKRLEVRSSHLEGVKPLVADGVITMGGAMLESHSTEGTPSFKGSAMLLMAESEEQAKELLSKDIYVRSGVWDLEKAQIIPFKSAVRTAL